ncbi:hypothetical protein SPMU_09170 [Sphingomonas mucosissima]|uniref:Uncharacterized protein n=1 Tax=Sphingomonas mucosissima TaxID=370959 RepID=A0A245ZS65_9SPHN|nr:hypothetical protein SPMU_09170 [Sphingomonas mucosissima]
MLFDYFTGATSGWRTEAKIRARRVMGEQVDDPIGYVDKRLTLVRVGSFERRRWAYIRTLVVRFVAEEEQRLRPARRPRSAR